MFWFEVTKTSFNWKLIISSDALRHLRLGFQFQRKRVSKQCNVRKKSLWYMECVQRNINLKSEGYWHWKSSLYSWMNPDYIVFRPYPISNILFSYLLKIKIYLNSIAYKYFKMAKKKQKPYHTIGKSQRISVWNKITGCCVICSSNQGTKVIWENR